MRVRLDAVVGVTLTVAVASSRDGVVRVMLYDGAKGFPTDLQAAERTAVGEASGGSATVVFQDVPAGTWAASAFLDRDNDGELDTAWFGMPTEPVGATSNGTGWGIGLPRFSGSSFVVATEPVSVEILLVEL